MKNDDKLILSARSAAVYRTDLSDETLELAANELDRLLYARFGERKRGGEIELPVDFRVRPEVKGFTVEVRDGKFSMRSMISKKQYPRYSSAKS